MPKFITYSKVAIVVIIAGLSFMLADYNITHAQSGTYLATSGLGQYIPDCTDINNCKDVSVFLEVAIGVGRYIFAIVGGLSLLMLIYGGITWINSHGNSEKVKKGFEICAAAIVGLAITFSAYMLVSYFAKNVVRVETQYQLKTPK